MRAHLRRRQYRMVCVLLPIETRGHAASNLKDALFEDVVQRVGDVAVIAGVVDCCAQPFGQTDLTVNALE